MDKENIQQMLSAMNIQNVQQVVIGEGHQTINYYAASRPEARHEDGDFLRRAVRSFMQFKKNHALVKWSDFFLLLKRKGVIAPDLNAADFGRLMEDNGGPSMETVRKSGDYNPSTADELKRKKFVDQLEALFY